MSIIYLLLPSTITVFFVLFDSFGSVEPSCVGLNTFAEQLALCQLDV